MFALISTSFLRPHLPHQLVLFVNLQKLSKKTVLFANNTVILIVFANRTVAWFGMTCIDI